MTVWRQPDCLLAGKCFHLLVNIKHYIVLFVIQYIYSVANFLTLTLTLTLTVQRSDHRNSSGCPGWLDFLLGVVFPGRAVP